MGLLVPITAYLQAHFPELVGYEDRLGRQSSTNRQTMEQDHGEARRDQQVGHPEIYDVFNDGRLARGAAATYIL